MRYAVIKNDTVENVIVAKSENQVELEKLLSAELEDASIYGLEAGDMRIDGKWTRNHAGEQITLDENATYDELLSYIEELEGLIYG